MSAPAGAIQLPGVAAPAAWIPHLASPWWLAAGAGAAAAIVLLHMVRPRPVRRDVSSTFLWRRLEMELRRQSPLRRLVPSLLMWLQVLAALLFGLSLARPSWTRPLQAAEMGVLLVDRSQSMQARDGERTRFEEAIERLSRVPGGPLPTGLQEFYVGGVGPSGTELAGPLRSPGEIRAALRAVPAPSDGEADYEAVQRQLAALAPEGTSLRVWVGTDGVMGAPARESLARLAARFALEVVPVAAGSHPPNLAVTGLAARRSGSSAGDVEVMAELANFGPRSASATVTVQGDFGVGARQPVELAPGEVRRLTFPYQVQGLGSLVVTLSSAEPDALESDDRRALVFGDPLDPVLAYVVGPAYDSLLHALTAAGNVAVVWSADSSSSPPPERADLVVFSEAPVPEAVEAWRAPLWLVTPPAGPPPGPEAASRESESVRSWRRTHPLLRFVDLDGVEVKRSPQAPAPPPDAEILAEGSGGPLIWERVDAQGQWRVETAFALRDSNLAGRVSFAVLVANLVRAAAPDRWDPVRQAAVAGQSLSLRLSEPSNVIVLGPDGSASPVRVEDGEFELRETERAGIYSVWPASGEPPEPLAMWAVQPAGAAESDLSEASWPQPEALGRSLPAVPRPEPLWPKVTLVATLLLAGEAALFFAVTRLPRAPAVMGSQESPAARLEAWARRRWVFTALRAVGLLAAVASLLDPHVPWPSSGRRVAFVVDVSSSVPRSAQEQARAFISRVVSHLGPEDVAWVVEAAESPRLAAAYAGSRPDPSKPLPLTPVDPLATDLQTALLAAASLIEGAGGSGRIVVLSDGNETRASALQAVADPSRFEGIAVDVVPVLERVTPELAVETLEVPQAGPAPGAHVRLQARIYSSLAQRVRLELARDGRVIWAGERDVPAGWWLFTFDDRPQGPPGTTIVYSLSASAPLDTFDANNGSRISVRIPGPPAVLYVSAGDDSAGARWLEAAGFRVEPITPDRLSVSRADLASASAVVLDDVPASAFSRPQLEALQAYVQQIGGGLVVTGGPHAFGPGGYRDTPLDEVLPVRSEVPRRLLIPQVALVLVLDKSGSMGERQRSGTKLDAARRAAVAAVQLLGPDDQVGVLAFDAEPRWIHPLAPLGDRSQILQSLARLGADGGTELGPALDEALGALEGVQAMVRHALVLSDGKSNPWDFDSLVEQAARRGITVSSVAVGPDADADLLARLARLGRGRSYYTQDIQRIPQIFVSETITLTRSALVTAPVRPIATEAGAAADRLLPEAPPEGWPLLGGYVATTPKPASSIRMASPEGDPILAAWRMGLGRVAAFTSSLTGGWGIPWQHTGLAPSLLVRMVRWAQAAATASDALLTADLSDDRGYLAAEVLDAEGRPVNFLELVAVVSDPRGESQTVELEQEAPGRYAGTFSALWPGEYVATVRAGPAQLQATAYRPYPAELEPRAPSPYLLTRLAALTGGRVLAAIGGSTGAQPAQPADAGSSVERVPALTLELASAADALGRASILAPAGWQARPIWPLLLLAAVALLVADVAVRQLRGGPRALWAMLREAAGSAAARARAALAGSAQPPLAQEIARRRREHDATDTLPTTGSENGGVDPTRAARLYLARLRKERRGR